jgi:alkylated DNA repair protein alkB family protein 7
VYPGFIAEAEGESLVVEAGRRLSRRRFEHGHWDSVITGYREVELPDDQYPRQGFDVEDRAAHVPSYLKAIQRTRKHLENHHFDGHGGCADGTVSNNIGWLPCHAIDLSANGELKPHVDSVKFSGKIVAGISLISDAIMRLRPSAKEWVSEEKDTEHSVGCGDSDGYVDLFLPKLSLYVLTGMSRYSFTHELLPSSATFELRHEDRDADVVDTNGCENISIDVLRGRRLSIIFRDAKTV